MVEKKSLVLAMEQAQQLSIQHPGITYRVMDKPRRRAAVNASDWVYEELVLDGWYTYCSYQDGRILA